MRVSVVVPAWNAAPCIGRARSVPRPGEPAVEAR